MFIPIIFPLLFHTPDRTEEIKDTIRDKVRRSAYQERERRAHEEFNQKVDWGGYKIDLPNGGYIRTDFVNHPIQTRLMFIKVVSGNMCLYVEASWSNWNKIVLEVKAYLKEKGVELDIPMPWLKQRENANA